MKKEEILKLAEEAVEETAKKFGIRNAEDEFLIGSKVDEVLPNGKISTLVCVDCSWLRNRGQKAIIDHDDLDEVEYKNNPSIEIDVDDIILTKWMDMVDADGDIHHCKIESFITMSESKDPFNPVEGTDWVVYVEV